jgi:hypothetical protein
MTKDPYNLYQFDVMELSCIQRMQSTILAMPYAPYTGDFAMDKAFIDLTDALNLELES